MEDRLYYLFDRYLANACTREELEEFFVYVNKAEHDDLLRQLIKKVYNELKDHYINTTWVDENGRLVLTEAGLSVVNPVPVTRPRKRKLQAILSIAAVLIVTTAIIWAIVKVSAGNDREANTMSSLTRKNTNRSESKFILLNDSTQVWMNAASSLEFPDRFDAGKREVFLSGEAFFDVKHADKIPFIIHTGKVSTTVLGTSFNIKAYPGEKNITISVSRGKVRVTRYDGREVVLIKGQQLKLNEAEQEAVEKNVPAEGIAGWQQGNIVYDDETLHDIIADMQRVYNVNIHVATPSIGGLRISTSFKREIGVEQALQVLCRLTDTELKQKEGLYLIQ